MKVENTYRISNIHSGHIFGLYTGSNEEEALLSMHKDAGYSSIEEANSVASVDEDEILVEDVKEALRDDVIDYIEENQDIVENGNIHVWSNIEGKLVHTINDHEYRDDEHVLIASFKIWNESKPYDREAFEFQYDNH